MIEAAYLMYHELESPGRKLCRDEPGYVRYVLTAEEFGRQLAHLREQDFRCLSVSAAFAANDEGRQPCVVLTFDDGCETDLLVAAPLLKEFNYNATFYVVAGFLGRPGYLSAEQLRELSSQGFDIGSHSMTHAYLPDLREEQMRAEIFDSKARLEEITGREVKHFSCPGGRWSALVAQLAQAAGYASVATSRQGKNNSDGDSFALKRLAVMRGTSVADFDRLCRAQLPLKTRAQGAALSAAKKLLGNSVYEKLRSAVLD